MSRSAVTATLLIAALAVGSLSHEVRETAFDMRAEWPEREEARLVPSPHQVRLLHGLVNREMLADWLWVQMLIYSGGRALGERGYTYLPAYVDATLAADPKFRRAYRWAAYAITFQRRSATQAEYLLSVRYLERAMQEFPDDYEFPWMLGLRYYLDLKPDTPEQKRKNREKAMGLIERAMRMPDAPSNLPVLAAGLATDLGKLDRAARILREQIALSTDAQAKKRMVRRYGALIGDSSAASALADASAEFEKRWRATLSYAPAGLYVLLGEPPSALIEFDDLATDRDLFGADLVNGADNDNDNDNDHTP